MTRPVPPHLVNKSEELLARSLRVQASIQDLLVIDHVESRLARECATLSSMFRPVMEAVDAGEMSFDTAFELLDAIFGITERNIAERRKQLALHARQ